jgi:hypothetical protein
VLPFESSPQIHLRWVRQGYEAVKKMAKTVDNFIIVGISYQPCDRLEINSIVDAVPINTTTKLVNLVPNLDLVKKLNMTHVKVKDVHPDEFLDYSI